MTVTMIVLKALGFWLGLTVIGSFISTKLSKLALWFKAPGSPLVIAIVYGLVAAAIAEVYFGLAMIIGSYTMGLVLSDTHLRHKIEKSIITINKIFVPAFFVIVGMQLDLSSFTGTGDKSMFSLVLFAIVLTVLAIFSKMVGSGLPALLFGFKKKESLRIGLGMVPRGEVALIIGGIAITSGVIGSGIFGVSIVMVIVTTILAPILLNLTYKD
jgi:Kef-type K+ transport system membrane component KefB